MSGKAVVVYSVPLDLQCLHQLAAILSPSTFEVRAVVAVSFHLEKVNMTNNNLLMKSSKLSVS